jgi:hypothetical protein
MSVLRRAFSGLVIGIRIPIPALSLSDHRALSKNS